MAQEKQLKQIEDALKDPQASPKVWSKVRKFLETTVADDFVLFNDGSILEELYKAVERKTCSGQTDAVDDILESITICKHVNLLLGKLPKSKLAEHKKASEFDEFLKAFEGLLKEAGDYDYQATLVEAALRILEPAEKESYTERWFPQSNIRAAFLAIKNQDFENGCRNFLNILNKSCGDNRSVHSIPCNGLYLGMYKVNVPDGQVDRNIWVDFNHGSKSVSAFVRDDSSSDVGDSSWETMIIKVQHVRDLRINDSDDVQILILKLTMPASELVPFCPKSPEHYAKILFSKDHNISSAIFKLFGAVRYIDLPYSSPSISSTPSKASTAKQPCILSSKNVRNSTGLHLREILKEPPFIVTSKDEKTPEPRSIIVDCHDEIPASKSFQVVTVKDGPTVSTGHTSNREDESDVIPETQDVELQIIEQKFSNKPFERKGSKSKLKSLIEPRLPRPRKAKTSAVSPFSYKEPDYSKTEASSSSTLVKSSPLKTQSSDKEKRDEGETKYSKSLIKQMQSSDKGKVQKGSNLDEEETRSRFSFTDPKKRKKKLPKKTFEKLRGKKRENNSTPRAKKHDWEKSCLAKGRVGSAEWLSSESDSDSIMSIPAYPVEKRATKWKRGRSKKRKVSESDSDVDVRLSKYQSKRSYTTDTINKSRKKRNGNEGKRKPKDVSIADLVCLYGKRDVSEEAPKAKKKTKTKKIKGDHSKSRQASAQAEDYSKELGTLSFRQAKKEATKMTEILMDDSDNEISWSNDDGEQADMEPVQFESRNKDGSRKRLNSDSKEKRLGHHSTSMLVNTSDLESEVDIEDKLNFKNVNDTLPSDSSNPVSSFAKICQDILDRSNRYAVLQLSDDEGTVKDGETDDLKKFLDSGILSDTSVRRSYAMSSFGMHEEAQDNCTATKVPEANSIEVESDKEKEAENSEDEEPDSCAKDTVLPHLKTPEVVKEFRSRCKLQGKEKRIPNKKQRLMNIVTCSNDEEIDEWGIESPRKRTRKRMKSGKSKACLSNTSAEITPLTNIDQNNHAIPSYGVGPLLNTLRNRVTGAMKRKESELQRFTNAAADLVNDKLRKIWSVQREERLEVLSGVDKKLRKEVALIRQDAERQHERQEKFLEFVLEHQRESIKASKDQIKKINNLESMNSALLSGIKDLEDKHASNENIIEDQLRKEISKLHTKLLHESRRKEILNVRKTLHTALSAM